MNINLENLNFIQLKNKRKVGTKVNICIPCQFEILGVCWNCGNESSFLGF
jgi:hypothetical protein